MSEYNNAEKPFLDKLKNLGWDIILSKYQQIKSGLMQDLLSGAVEVEVGEKEFEIEN